MTKYTEMNYRLLAAFLDAQELIPNVSGNVPCPAFHC